jgi:hypothetical protein
VQHQEDKLSSFLEDEGVLWYKGRNCVPNVKELKDKILCEAHESAYSIHPGGNKMYHDLKATYWWYGMKRDVVVGAHKTPISCTNISSKCMK